MIPAAAIGVRGTMRYKRLLRVQSGTRRCRGAVTALVAAQGCHFKNVNILADLATKVVTSRDFHSTR